MKTNSRFPQGSLVFAYLRHSPGDNQTITSQDAAVRTWCSENGVELGRVFKDEAKSGTTTVGRDEFFRLIDLLHDSQIKPRPSGVVLWSFSRFARDFDDAEYYKSDLRRLGYIVYSITDQVPDGDIGRVFEAFIHWKDAERSREISRDAQRGLQWLAKLGYSIGGFPPRGYRKSAPIEVGRKKNGEPRQAYKWEIDTKSESRVRKAWQLKLQGRLNWEIHRATRIFDSINSYTTFFSNLTYAGFRKCGSLLIPNAHPAYISKEQFDRVQANKQPAPANRPRGSDPNHPRRRTSDNPLLLSGILFCGYCGAAMVGNKNGREHFYTCNRKQRQGYEVCGQPSIVSYALDDIICDWLTSNVLTTERLIEARDQVNRRLNGSKEEMRQRQIALLDERARVDKRMQNLIDAIEDNGSTLEIERRLAQRKVESQSIEQELKEIEQALNDQRLELSNEAMEYLAQDLRGKLQGGNPDYARSVIRLVVKRVELLKEKIIAQYVLPLGDLSNQPKVGFSVCPHGGTVHITLCP